MRSFVLSAGLVILLTPCAWAQAPLDSTNTGTLPGQSLTQLAEGFFAQPIPSRRPRSAAVARSMTGTTIGAVIGAGAGIAAAMGAVKASCEGAHCAPSSYAMAAAYGGALGAGLGALIGSNFHLSHPRNHPTVSPRRHVQVAPVIAPDVRGGRVTVRF